MKILVLNAGSSSQKSCLYEIQSEPSSQPPSPLWEGKVDWTHEQGYAEIEVKTSTGACLQEKIAADSRPIVISHLLATLWQGDTQVIDQPNEIAVVGHRVVHGGAEYRKSVFITAEVKAAIARLASFAPVHNPANLEGIEAVETLFGNIPQVAVFDTAFHAHLPLAAAIYPGPYEWYEQGIRRYGFHGISHRYCAERAAQLLDRDLSSLRLITCHLGNGCSLAAIQNGISIETTMGFTPMEGLMMGSRSGSIDPGILIHLLRHQGYSADKLDQVLNKQSGLLGVSGISADLRRIDQAIAAGNDRAKLALEIYIHRLQSAIGACLPHLGGLDALIFTAGVGENSATVRAATCAGFEYLNWQIDQDQNQPSAQDRDIATPDSAVRILVIHTQEDWAIAQDCWQLIQTNSQS
uniref:Acetate kinase n=1 Tax=Cyanothece sp. (strain PCC 7425 / ATCC 29141) TaxID=395961 RepID=ACKA_CYAP4|nr:RecName: Full=Acetate kinase; AltName: Full=Acetokinase [Cyanothece sp. PCC 7425]